MSSVTFSGLDVLVVDDDVLLRKRIVSVLERLGAEVSAAENLQAARALLSAMSFDFALLDVNLPDGLGTDLLKEKAFPADTAVIVITPIPSPTPVDAYTLSEEELAAIIDQSVNEAISAYETATAATQQAYQDGSLSSEELEAAYYAYAYAEDEIEAALALADEYLALYAELGEETIALLTAIEEDLSAMASAAEAASATLNEIYANVQAGVQVTQQNIEADPDPSSPVSARIVLGENYNSCPATSNMAGDVPLAPDTDLIPTATP